MLLTRGGRSGPDLSLPVAGNIGISPGTDPDHWHSLKSSIPFRKTDHTAEHRYSGLAQWSKDYPLCTGTLLSFNSYEDMPALNRNIPFLSTSKADFPLAMASSWSVGGYLDLRTWTTEQRQPHPLGG